MSLGPPTILHGGFKALRQFFQSPRFRSAPILLLESVMGDRPASKAVDSACRHVHALLTQQLGLRTASAHASPAVFPTLSDIDHQVELAARTGATTIVGVGTGPAMDLASATASAMHAEELVLIPATYSAMMVAASSSALVLDTAEEALVTKARPRQLSTVAILESSLVDERRHEAILASMALLLDHFLTDQSTGSKITELAALLGTDHHHERLADVLIEVGTDCLSYGDSDRDRSLSLALAASLVPVVFPHHGLVEFMASLVPALSRMVEQQQQHGSIAGLDESVRSLAPTIVTTEPLDTLLGHIDANQALWNCFDADRRQMAEVLQDHVLS